MKDRELPDVCRSGPGPVLCCVTLGKQLTGLWLNRGTAQVVPEMKPCCTLFDPRMRGGSVGSPSPVGSRPYLAPGSAAPALARGGEGVAAASPVPPSCCDCRNPGPKRKEKGKKH